MVSKTASVAIEDLWARENFAPNPAQRAAITHGDGPLYLPAGPGSGKTRVLLWRAVNLIVFRGVEPEAITLSTFTEKAALQLKEGLRVLLGAASARTRSDQNGYTQWRRGRVRGLRAGGRCDRGWGIPCAEPGGDRCKAAGGKPHLCQGCLRQLRRPVLVRVVSYLFEQRSRGRRMVDDGAGIKNRVR